MGAQTFICDGRGANAQEAFTAAVKYALHMYGHAGYTGTIAEKNDFTVIDPNAEGRDTSPWQHADYVQYADELLDECDPRVDDKWGPAGCLQTGEREFLFFGWASS